MIYYLTQTSPLVFTTQKADRVEEWMIPAMLEELLKREYEMYSPKEAKDNLQQILQTDEVFLGVLTPPSKEPTQAEMQMWIQEFLLTEAGRKLLSQAGQPLSKQKKSDLNLEEMILSDLLPELTIASEWDSEGPQMHSEMNSQSSNEA